MRRIGWPYIRVLLGDQIFLVDNADFSARWDWVPLLDFAACLYAIIGRLKSKVDEEIYGFTESEALLQFNRQGEFVLITSSYTSAKATVLQDELAEASSAYAKRVLLDAIARHPELAKNPSLRSWYPFAESVISGEVG